MKKLLLVMIPFIFSGCALFKAPPIATDSESTINQNITDGKTTKDEVVKLYRRGSSFGMPSQKNVEFVSYDRDYATPFGTFITHTKLILLYKNNIVMKHHLIRYKDRGKSDFLFNTTKDQLDSKISNGVTTLKDIQQRYGVPYNIGYTGDNDLYYEYYTDNMSLFHFSINGVDSRDYEKIKKTTLSIYFSGNNVVTHHSLIIPE
ncbi:hypothetical protein [Acerihabitans arboris]|uniref:Lipoprotein n=1 Tax=Acerihabitans arboris TaxID=2691583 RepID=A0A845SKC7_9GAMM|nr:hypothetical protein [Acerihabitans arboris]NDL61775.1 hypothetical protein [Acerihabitans arboris]